jgi:hypothetical protein
MSAGSNRDALRYITYPCPMNCGVFIKFLNNIVRTTDEKVFLIVDNLRVHPGKLAQERKDEHSDELEFVSFFLPKVQS